MRIGLFFIATLLGGQVIQVERMKADLVALSTREMNGRVALEPGAAKAAQLVADEFRKAGLRPGGDGKYLQEFLLKAVREDIDLTRHMADAVRSLAVCLAADASVRTGLAVKL